ncbi:MAG TPA: aldehyde dehydrogenase (NADP(+)) [Candidatus Binatia bacterium]
MAALEKVLIGGRWRTTRASGIFNAVNPANRSPLPGLYPVSALDDVEEAVEAAARAAESLAGLEPERLADFLERYARRIEGRREELVQTAFEETALAREPRLNSVELPRTTGQLRQAAQAARDRSWTLPTIDTASGIRSFYGPLGGGVVVFGPNNFPFAFNSVAGGDFAAAVAAGNPVIAKANTGHPGTTRLLAEEAFQALGEAGLPQQTVQLLYRTDHDVGAKLVSHPRVGATGYTGSRPAGLVLKAAADKAGKPIYLELSSSNPVIVLPGAFKERFDRTVEEFVGSCLMGTGQFCTNPGIVILMRGPEAERFIQGIKERFDTATPGTLLGSGVLEGLTQSVAALVRNGAQIVTGGVPGGGEGFSYRNTLLRVGGKGFIKNPEALQREAFGNASLFIVAEDGAELLEVVRRLEGNLTGAVYSGAQEDETLYRQLEPILRRKVGRLLNDKMPTGVAVSPAMNHGGPFPATGHPGFTAVGIPASIRRFAMLECYDNVRVHRLPPELRDKNPTGKLWRFIDGQWTRADCG